MTNGPTRGAVSLPGEQWNASPATAFSIRVIAAVVPFFVAWFAVTALADSFLRPDGPVGVVIWVFQALATGLSVSMTTELFTRRMLPLASLFNMTLVFPDQAPSRFSVALRSGTLRKLESQIGETGPAAAGGSPTEAAGAAVRLVTRLGQHDRMTRGHTERVRAHSDLIAEELGLSMAERQKLAWGAMLHDVGKIAVPAHILNREDGLTDAEWEVLQDHPAASIPILEPLVDWLGEWVLAAPQHHERWDGTGYPLGLAGTEISLAGRIVAVADAYDVMTSRRSYKVPLSPETARKELIRCSGSQFDPEVVRALLNVSLRRRWLTGPLATLAELPQVANLGANLPAASAVVAGTVAAAGSLALGPGAGVDDDPNLAFVEPAVVIEEEWAPADASTTSASILSVDSGDPVVTTVPEAQAPTEPPQPTETDQTTTTVETVTTESVTTTMPAPTTTQAPTTTVATTTPTTQPSTTTTLATTSTPPPAPPLAVDDSVSAEAGWNNRIWVLDNDDPGDSSFVASTLEVITDPLHAESFWVHKKHIHFWPDDEYEGTDSFVYRICTTDGLCDTATVTVTVYED